MDLRSLLNTFFFKLKTLQIPEYVFFLLLNISCFYKLETKLTLLGADGRSQDSASLQMLLVNTEIIPLICGFV